MANTPQSKKRARQIERRTDVNKARRSRIRTFIRKVEEAIASGNADAARAALTANAPLIERLARVNAPVDGAAGRGMIAVAVQGASFALPIGDVIDVAAETARLQKSVAKSEKDADGLRKRLGNPKFVENAEAEVIEETREKLAALDDDIARLKAALAQLAAM